MKSSGLENFLLNYRWIFVCLFLLPLSFLFNLTTLIREKIVFFLYSDPKKHNEKVKRVQKKLIEFNKELSAVKDASKRPIVCTARPGWQTMSFRFPKYKNQNKYQLNLNNFVDVIEMDKENKYVTVEPGMSIRQINGYLLKEGFTLPIVPELDDLTIGGLIMGTGIESSSFLYGLFDKTCLEFEVLLPTGELIKCNKNDDSDLFSALPWSYGTLGYLMCVKLKIIPAKKYIRLEYESFKNIDPYSKRMNDLLKNSDKSGLQFIEGLILQKDRLVLMTGRMDDDLRKGDKLNEIGKWHKPWFYKHVDLICFDEKTGSSKTPKPEVIPLLDYYHRHSRSIFWEMEQIVPFGNNFLFRLIFGWMQPIKIGLLKLTQTQKIKELYESNHLIQDLLVPIQDLKLSINFFDEICKIYPIWICPFRLNRSLEQGFLAGKKGQKVDLLDNFFVDIGLYGVPGVKNFNPEICTRKIEEKCRQLGGFQMLYADTFMTREEFHQMFNHKLYWKVREDYKIESHLPEVYDKINRRARI